MAEQHEYATAVDDYLTRAYDGDRRRVLLDRGGWDAELAAESADLGWYALAVPEDRGGLGATLSDLGPVFEQYGRHLVIGPQLENSLLPALVEGVDADGKGVPAALVDPGAGALGTAVLTGDRLTGTVDAVRFAAQADRLVVVAGEAVCLVGAAAPGVRIEALDSADPATAFARVTLEEVVPDEVLTGDGRVAGLRSWARLLLACELSGLARGALDRTVEHIGQREQFGRPIGSFQAVQHIAADMHARSTGLHNLCLSAVADADGAPPAALDLLASTAKAHAAEAAVGVCEDAIQLHGGMGFTTESDVSWFYRRALALRGWYGDEVELRQRVGAALLDGGRAA
ncbi:acyl-CoA dehydrogenase [Pseudonocardia sp. KRD-184]|uniref:Acyl-CoA dehydrogenase n=1 Tax=Pseudonocardia oceani TaxID=2792013 RepID=A0ABS6UGH6_9PSEU|nr:acyl-CoA dehydrogenase family protein [Pseudonocardia oceani]MBW0088107.1 acyl-CoA dehydrogenase [Pseudonocardia oceani]MBW0094700.1 acyl-CoA dehydrogenase [Pseudonocardia oceani]MBW0107298.1 acyl-CoA dehydrogenase [Pseudonocardia oceani]MBW0120412.1 acyl-CoA dehydrogenase [Pseudonocardia oceani]MBW0131334.1 acyl-CoA dehydrogenase [Pseudonocardia oceani]